MTCKSESIKLIRHSILNLERESDIASLASFTCALSPCLTTPPGAPTNGGVDDKKPGTPSENQERRKQRLVTHKQSSAISGSSWERYLSLIFTPSKPADKSLRPSVSSGRFLSSSSSPPDPHHIRSTSISTLAQGSALSDLQEEHRTLRRTNSTLHTFAIPFANAIQYSHSAASSPPNSFAKKKMSPAGSLLSTGNLAGAWPPPHWLQRASLGSEDSRSTISPPKVKKWAKEQLTEESTSKPILTARFMNQDHFKAQGPLFADSRELARHQKWREDYADMLFASGMAIDGAAMKKYSHPSPEVPPTNRPLHGSLPDQGKCLVFKRCCGNCGRAISKVGQELCSTCHRSQRTPTCDFCRKRISGLASPCLNCGHTLHLTCRLSLETLGIEECVTGCGCLCNEHTTKEMPLPEPPKPEQESEKPPVVQPARPQMTRSLSSNQDDLAYNSLAKALTKRRESRGGLKVTSSQIWRGG